MNVLAPQISTPLLTSGVPLPEVKPLVTAYVRYSYFILALSNVSCGLTFERRLLRHLAMYVASV